MRTVNFRYSAGHTCNRVKRAQQLVSLGGGLMIATSQEAFEAGKQDIEHHRFK
jgi:hypothetical protein